MKSDMKNYIAILFLIAICCSTASAIKCFECTSTKEPKCKEAKGLQSVECPVISEEKKQQGAKWACLKAVIELNLMKITVRKCAYQQGQTSPCLKFANITKDYTCTVCDEDYCNGPLPNKGGNASKLVAWTPVLGALFAVLKLLN